MTDKAICRIEGQVGRISLNRPKAIHALDLDMVLAMTAALVEWRDDPEVEVFLIDHHEGRGFCAGGDVIAIAQSAMGTGAATMAFFHAEYRLNHLLFTYPKPTAVFMDGVTMGGGVGIARPCRYRIATDRTLFAMPETSIGLFPDVGGGWHLSRLIGRLPQFLALTGARLDGAECFALGLATHYIPHGELDALKHDIARDPDRIDAWLAHAQAAPPPARIKTDRDKICRLFEAETLEGVLADLEADGSGWALKELATLRRKSPTACKVSLRLLDRGAQMRDFAEGVRALLIDKDHEPRWYPARAEEVTEAMLDELFQPLLPERAWTPL